MAAPVRWTNFPKRPEDNVSVGNQRIVNRFEIKPRLNSPNQSFFPPSNLTNFPPPTAPLLQNQNQRFVPPQNNFVSPPNNFGPPQNILVSPPNNFVSTRNDNSFRELSNAPQFATDLTRPPFPQNLNQIGRPITNDHVTVLQQGQSIPHGIHQKTDQTDVDLRFHCNIHISQNSMPLNSSINEFQRSDMQHSVVNQFELPNFSNPPPFHSYKRQSEFQPVSAYQGLNMSTINDQKESALYMTRNEDAEYLEMWLRNKPGNVKMQNLAPRKHPILKISDVQDKTRNIIVLLAKLQKNKMMLETLKNEDKMIWDQKLKEVMTMKHEIEAVQKELMSEDVVKEVKRKVTERRKKREWIKRRKQQQYETKLQELSAREQKHAEIDKALHQINEQQKLSKQEEDMQKEGDEILGQVRKKIAETNRTIELIDGLQKLRKLRTERLERQGVLNMFGPQGSSTNRAMFEAKIANSIQMLNKQLVVYRAEEDTLKVILESEQEETREKEREKAKQKELERLESEAKMEEQMLFGCQKEAQPGDPLYPFRQYYDGANNSLEHLVLIRREWDTYLVMPGTPGSSGIPEGWVIPTEPSSDNWAIAVVNKDL